MRLLRAGDYVERPWKNGGGVTRAIYTFPHGAGYDAFVWQLSSAHVASDGPFSAFPGVDRSLAVLSEGELRLCGLGDERTLSRACPPLAFVGETPVEAKLCGTPVHDFNVMTRRAACRHTLVREVLGTGVYKKKAAILASFLFLEEGKLHAHAEAGDVDVSVEDTLILEPLEVCTLRISHSARLLWGDIVASST